MSPAIIFTEGQHSPFCLLGRGGRYRLLRLCAASPFYTDKLIYSLLLSPCGGLSVLMTTYSTSLIHFLETLNLYDYDVKIKLQFQKEGI